MGVINAPAVCKMPETLHRCGTTNMQRLPPSKQNNHQREQPPPLPPTCPRPGPTLDHVQPSSSHRHTETSCVWKNMFCGLDLNWIKLSELYMDEFGFYIHSSYIAVWRRFFLGFPSGEVRKNSCRQKWHLLNVKSCQELLNSYKFECLVTKW